MISKRKGLKKESERRSGHFLVKIASSACHSVSSGHFIVFIIIFFLGSYMSLSIASYPYIQKGLELQ